MEHVEGTGLAVLDQRQPAANADGRPGGGTLFLDRREAGEFLALVEILTTAEPAHAAAPTIPSSRDWSGVTRLGGFL